MSDEIALNPQQLITALTAAGKARLRILIKGAPGIGKTQIVRAVAAALGATLITMHPSVSDPTDFKGLPFIVDGHAEFLPFGELEKVLNAKSLTILFLDDLGQGSTAVQAGVMQLADRIKGNQNVVLWAATNERVHRAGVTGLLEPVKSRFDSIIKLVTDFSSWKVWAVDHDIDYRIAAYLEQHQDALHKFDPTVDIVNQPMPRTWESSSNVLKLDMANGDVRFAMLIGAVGQGAATSLHAWLKLAEQAPSRDEVIADPHNTRIPAESSAMYAVVSSLALAFEKKEFPAIAIYAQRMYAADNGECCALLLKDIYRKCPEIEKTQAFTKLASSPLSKLLLEAVRFNQTTGA